LDITKTPPLKDVDVNQLCGGRKRWEGEYEKVLPELVNSGVSR
jgi:hypothetical protein